MQILQVQSAKESVLTIAKMKRMQQVVSGKKTKKFVRFIHNHFLMGAEVLAMSAGSSQKVSHLSIYFYKGNWAHVDIVA